MYSSVPLATINQLKSTKKMLKKIIKTTFLGCLMLFSAEISAQNLTYTVNLNDRSNDEFKVTLDLDKGLKSSAAIYQFASTAPGTYQVMNIGRFVRSFKAFDAKGVEISTEKIGENQYKISKPKETRKIQYNIAEIWDTKVDKDRIYAMCGSSIEEDHALINGQTVFGYPTGMQDKPLKIKIDFPKEWTFGTALSQDKNGFFEANNYDHIVDSPILMGRLTKATAKVAGADIEVYTYSKTDKIKSDLLLNGMSDMLKAAGAFLKELPVKKYTFLFHFEDRSAGAWEHSYSSEYILKETEWSKEVAEGVVDIAAHEFFHVVTPLNIHSELISNFNFVTPTASEHLWLYEGTTEWASHKMQLNAGLKPLDEYFKELQLKIRVDENRFDNNFSLSKMSLTSFTPEGQKQYGNIYMRGALVAGLLDIRLLELSGGKRGLREVINEFAKIYGANKSFPEKKWFKVFVKKTYPEIADFFEKYIKNANPLPIEDYFKKIGIKYTKIDKEPKFEIAEDATPAQIALRKQWMTNF